MTLLARIRSTSGGEIARLPLVCTLVLLTACTTGSNPLRAVGARDLAAAPTVDASQMETGSLQEAATPLEPKLKQGALMNVSTSSDPSQLALVQEEVPPVPEMAATREEAVQQIREKAANTGDNKPNIFDVKRSQVPRLTPQEQAELTAEMKAAAARNAATLSEEEAAAKSNGARLLKLKAQTHYDKAVKNIEN